MFWGQTISAQNEGLYVELYLNVITMTIRINDVKRRNIKRVSCGHFCGR